MGERVTERKSETYCDRCSAVFDPSKKPNLQGMTKIVETFTVVKYRLVAVFYGKQGPQVLKSQVDLCDHCQWEFDALFLQGREVPWHPNRRRHELPKNPNEPFLLPDGKQR